MAPTSKKKGAAPAASASKSVVQPKVTRAERSARNRAEHQSTRAAANTLVHTITTEQKRIGRIAAGPSIAEIIGKPVKWSESLSEAVFALVSTGHSMAEIAAIEGMPSVFQMLKWLVEPTHPFSVMRARAKEMLVPLYEEQAQRIAVNTNSTVLKTRRQVLTKDGEIVWVTEKKTIDNVARSALALQGLQWTLGHLMPKKHGRLPDPNADKPNEQLEGLFAALKSGPAS